MTSTLDTRPDVTAYLAAVRAQLADLPAADREDLLAEVAASVVDAAADGSIEARLGNAAQFAHELRSAAGIEPVETAPRFDVRELALRIGAHIRPLRELVPIWWAVRGYVLITALGFTAGWSYRHPSLPHLMNSVYDARLAVCAIALGVFASACLGLAGRRLPVRARRATWILDAAVIALLIPVSLHLAHVRPVVETTYVGSPVPLQLLYNGNPVQNIYAYTRDGKFLHDVLLYDQYGNPISVNRNDGDPNRRVLHTAGKYVPIYNSFPIRYFAPGTHTVAHPNAGPRVRIAKLAPGP